MGFVSKKRGRLGFALFRGQKANIMHEFYYILFQLIMVVLVLAALIAYTNNVATDLGFEKRFTSIDLALLTDVVYYAPGTLRKVYTPMAGGDQLLIKGNLRADFGNGTVGIDEARTSLFEGDLPPVMFWYRSDRNMDVLSDRFSLQGTQVDARSYSPPNLTYYKSGRKIAFNEDNTNALHMVCPTVNTSDPDWISKKIFVAKMLPSAADYSNQSLAVNRIAQVLSARYANFQVSGSGSSAPVASGGAQISAIPDDADIVIALGDSGEEREPGALVAYVPADDDLLVSKKLACTVLNDLLSPETTVYYTQIMPVYVDELDSDSPLSIFRERSSEGQVLVFIDTSNFGEDQISVDNVARGLYIGVQRYYGDEELEPLRGATFNFTITGDVLAALAAFGVSVPGAGMPGVGVPGSAANQIEGSGGSAPRRMFSVCTQRADALGIAEGMQRLKDVTAYWAEQGMDDGAVYVRGGQTNRASLACSNHGEAAWIIPRMTGWFPGFSQPSVCTVTEPSPEQRQQCLSDLREAYQSRVVSTFSGRYFCGDCGTSLVQLYNCAFGKTNLGLGNEEFNHPITAPIIAATPGTKAQYNDRGQLDAVPEERGTRGAKEKYFGHPTGSCWDEVIQGQLGGQLQFGDVIELPGHWVMYTGGAGLDYDILEMGGWRWGPGAVITPTRSSAEFNGKGVGGFRTVQNIQAALNGPRLQFGCLVRRIGDHPISDNVELV